ncbi:acyl-CoA synthetase (AMP-forming)/AMP-acid ligase II [Catenuloplanes nepalensis]|uniref:Acyl-CoA synthetase (AMP-forming)/AMP-acid ligase II n=1 Tax=Catenuloplanes nepalensis TaxID=587533 RepID=A0ABT9MM95_9ACTN|nr:hypothetical protein [Catenuloplanes nepalensis]MDP9792548.1 acyl-CoA synthetase (AMP-forming)/AMP-acid ligase II [Catenuloplanes nepalensis]
MPSPDGAARPHADLALEIGQALERLADTSPDRPAIIDDDGTLTVADLVTAAARRAQDFDSAPGRLVDVAPFGRELIIGVLAVWLAAGIPRVSNQQQPCDRRARRLPHTCRPWLAGEARYGGGDRTVVLGGAAPLAPLTPALRPGPGQVLLVSQRLRRLPVLHTVLRHLLDGGITVLVGRPRSPVSCWRQAVSRWPDAWAMPSAEHLDVLLTGPADAVAAGLRALMYTDLPSDTAALQRAVSARGSTRMLRVYDRLGYTCVQESAGLLQPVAGSRIRIVDADGNVCGPGRTGTLEGTGAYDLTCHDITAPCPEPGTWHSVGDLGMVTAAGDLAWVDLGTAHRAVVDGTRVAFNRIFRAVRYHPAVVSCRVHAIPDDRRGHAIAVRALTTGHLDPEVLIDHCRRALPPEHQPALITATAVRLPEARR